MASFIGSDWSEQDSDDCLPGEPARSVQIQAALGNPCAIAAGKDGAPRVQGIALGGTYLGGGALTTSGLVYTDLDGAGWVKFDVSASYASNTFYVRLYLSSDNGSTWSSSVQASNTVTNASGSWIGTLKVNLQTGEYFTHGLAAALGAVSYSGTIAVTNANAIKLNLSASGPAFADATILSGLE